MMFKNMETGNGMMSYEEFTETVRRKVQELAGGTAYVRIEAIRKANVPETLALTVTDASRSENISRAIYLKPLYEEYLEGTTVDIIASAVLTLSRDRKEKHMDMSYFADFEKVKSGICFRLINRVMNEELLEEVPYKSFLDLAVVYYYQFESSAFGNASILIRKEHMKKWGIDGETLHETAAANMRRNGGSRFLTLDSILQNMAGIPEMCPHDRDAIMYVLTNEAMQYGAAVMAFDDVLENIADSLDGDFFLLPSSIHECMVVPCRDWDNPESLSAIVSEINAGFLSQEEILSNSVYRYCREKRELIIAA